MRSTRNSSNLDQSAVAKVLENHLWDSGEIPDTVSLARLLKDRVSRALRGETISSITLSWFIEAFAMFTGREEPGSEISHILRRRHEMIMRQGHRTTNLVERYIVDGDGFLRSRNTNQTIRAVEDGVDMYIFNHEPQASRVEVVFGGTVGREFLYGNGLRSAGIVLERPLAKGQKALLEYRTFFDPGSTSLTEVRRAAFARVENVDIAVHFEGRIPRFAWWCVWADHLEGSPVQQDPVTVTNRRIRMNVDSIQETVVGFRWDW